MNRSEMRTYIRTLLGVEPTDRLYTDARLNTLLEQTHNSLLDAIQRESPRWFQKTATVTLSFAAVALPSDFSRMLEVRLGTSSGVELNEVHIEDLGNIVGETASFANSAYAVTGPDDGATITACAPFTNENLWLRYQYWPTAFTTDVAPTGLPPAYHEVVPLEAIFVFELGSELEVPATLQRRWQERKGAMFAHIAMRSHQPTRVSDPNTRFGLRSLLRTYLGVNDRDEAFTDARLNMLLRNAHRALVADVQDTNPSYLMRVNTALLPKGGAGHVYPINDTTTNSITDFARVAELRLVDETGDELREVRADSLRRSGVGAYTIYDEPSDGVTIETSEQTEAGKTLWLRYAYYPSDMSADTDAPGGIIPEYVDVVALEAFSATPGASKRSPETFEKWTDRRSQFMSRVGRQSHDPFRQRLVQPFDADVL